MLESLKKYGWLLLMALLATNWALQEFKLLPLPTDRDEPTLASLPASLTEALAQPQRLLEPAPRKDLQVVYQRGFVLGYSEAHEQPAWVGYKLTEQRLNTPKAENRSRFRMDPKVTTYTAHVEDYKNSGYDRGHLAPFGDMRWSEDAAFDSFYFSNISPQLRGFNAGEWASLEEHIRQMARRHQEIIVLTGPVLEPGLPTIGVRNKVSVPRYFYKVVLDITPPTIEMAGFVMPHVENPGPITQFLVTVDSVQRLTGLDFFAYLPDSVERILETRVNRSHWFPDRHLQ